MRRAAFAILVVASPAAAQVEVVDGDTIRVEGVRVRLFGIDSPERGQPGARESTKHLRRLIGSQRVDCTPVDYDRRNDRPVSLCDAGGQDLSLAQVRAGEAVVWCYYIRKLRPALLATFQKAETEAKAAKRGIWARPFKPWREWRC